MDKQTIKKILELNKQFYNQIANEFSQTRQTPWKGWFEISKIIREHFPSKTNLTILDLGCGNGRFYGFLTKELQNFHLHYLGADQNQHFLSEAEKKYGKKNFKKIDIFQNLDALGSSSYQLVVAFGVIHHLPSKNLRLEWLGKASNLTKLNGLFIFNLWNFQKNSIFKKAKRRLQIKDCAISPKHLERDDYFLPWRNRKDIYRYTHLFDSREIAAIINQLSITGLTLLTKFPADGKNNQNNLYLVFKKDQKSKR